MKDRFFTLFLPAILLISTGCSSCKDDIIEPTETETYTITQVDINGSVYNKLEGIVNRDLTLDQNQKWLISGGVFVDDGSTLTINQGGTIWADTEVTTFLSVKQGGKVYIEGTDTDPVVFTPLTNSPNW